MNLNFYIVNWNTCCPPVCRGGLGIKKLFLFNQVFWVSGVMNLKIWFYGDR